MHDQAPSLGYIRPFSGVYSSAINKLYRQLCGTDLVYPLQCELDEAADEARTRTDITLDWLTVGSGQGGDATGAAGSKGTVIYGRSLFGLSVILIGEIRELIANNVKAARSPSQVKSCHRNGLG